MRYHTFRPTQAQEPDKIEEKMEEPELQAQDEEEKEEIEEIEKQREQEEEKSEEIPEQKPEGKQVPEEFQADKPKLCQELSVDQTTQTETVPPPQDEQPFGPSPVATEFSGLKPLSALEPQMSQFLDQRPKRWSNVTSTPGWVYIYLLWLVDWKISMFNTPEVGRTIPKSLKFMNWNIWITS